MTQVMSPEVKAAAQSALEQHRQALDGLHTDLTSIGDYADAASESQASDLFAAQLERTKGLVASSHNAGDSRVAPDEAVDVLMRVGSPFVDHEIEKLTPEALSLSGLTSPTAEELSEVHDRIRANIRDGLVAIVTPEDDSQDKVEDKVSILDAFPAFGIAAEWVRNKRSGERQKDGKADKGGAFPTISGLIDRFKSGDKDEGIVARATSAFKRVSVTAKKTREDYKQYKMLQNKQYEFDAGSDERQAAIDKAKEYRRENLVPRFAKTTGIVAVGAFAAQSLRTKGIDVTNWVEDKGDVVEAVGAGIAYTGMVTAIERFRIRKDIVKDKAKDTGLRVQLHAMNGAKTVFSKVATGWREKQFSGWDDLADIDEERSKKFAAIDEEKDRLTEVIDNFKETRGDKFDENSPEYKELVRQLEEIEAKEVALEDEVIELYGKKKLTRKAKIGMAVGAVAAVGAGAYLWKYGLSLPSSGNKSGGAAEHAPSGNKSGNGAEHAPSGGNGGSGTVDQTPADTSPAPAPSSPAKPQGLNQAASSAFDKLTPSQKTKFTTAFEGYTPQQKASFNTFADGVQTIQVKNPGASPQQVNQLVGDTLRLSEMRGQFVGDTDPVTKALREAQFDWNFKRFIETTR